MNYLSKLFVLALCATVCLFFAAGTAFAAQPAISELSQVRNGPSTSPSVNWQNGNVNATQSHMVEGYSVPYRAVMINLPIGTPIELTLGYDIKHSNRHALDYLTHYQRLEPHGPWGHAAEVIDPRDGHTDVPATFMTFPIPPPSSAGSPVAGQPTTSFNNLLPPERVFTIYGGTITNVQYVSEGSLTASNSETRIKVTFTASASKVILAWGGHIATRQDWGFDSQGVPRSAGGISGSPYHMRAIDWNLGNLGNMDRSLAAAAVFPECDITGPSTACAGQTGLTFTTPFTSGFTYSWSFVGPTNGAVFTSATNTNTVTVTAGTGNFTVRVSVTSSGSTISCDHPVVVSNITVGSSATNVTCFGGNDGSVTVTANGGTPPYQVTLGGNTQTITTNGGSTTFTGLSAGTHNFSVVDDAGCTANGSQAVGQPSELTCSVTVTNHVSCNGGSDGSISVSVSGGTGPYQYSLDGVNFQSSNTFSGLTAGSYTVTVKDANNCTTTCSATVNQPAPLTCSVTVTNHVSCNGGSDGSISVSVSGGTGPYQYSLDGVNFQSSNTFSGLTAGSYTVTVKDANNCTTTCSATLNQPAPLTCSVTVTNHVSCNGGSDGSISVSVSGGTGPYQYSLDGVNFQSSNTFSGLTAGSYTVTVKDANNCTTTCSATLNQPAPLTCSVTVTNHVSCNGGSDGSISVSVSGGTGPYQYSLDGVNFQSSNTFSGLTAGSYTVTVKDANNCTTTCSATLNQPAPLTCSVTVTNHVSCNGGSDGSISVSVSGGTGPYQYSLDGVNFQSSNTFSGLTAGSYTVTVRDANNCTTTCSATVNEPAPLTASVNSATVCPADLPVAISATVNGGTAPYSYVWTVPSGQTNPGNSATVNATVAGTYSVVVTDNKGCTASASGTLTVNENTSTTAIVGGEVCATSHTFSTTASGTGPFTFTWKRDGVVITNQPNRFTITSGVNTSSLLVESITVADYAIDWTVVVQGLCNRDSSTAQLSCSFTCGDPGEDEVCEGETATFCALPSGGVAPYTFSWVGPGGFASTDSCVTVGVDGIYTVTITDAVGNSCSQNYTLTVNPLPDASIIPPTSAPACGSEGNSLSAQQVTGATYSWTLLSGGGDGWAITGGANTHTITYTAGNTGTSGEFEVTVTSSAGCESRDTLTVNCTTVDAFCTLTQGFYGNYGGRHCGTTTLALIQQLLSSGPIVLGLSGQSFTVGTGDANCVIKRLPGGGPPRPLLSGNHGFDNASDCNFTGVTLKNGRFHNVLFAQALTLALNLRLDADLGDVRITNTVLVTAASSDPCAPGHGSPVPGTEENFLIPGSVLTALGSNNTVADLLALANQALGGGTTGGASLGDIATALGAINDGFDKCRFLVGFIAVPTVAGIKGHAIVYSNQIYGNELPTEYALQHNYPNPFNPSTVIEFALPEASMVRLSIYNLLGQEVATLVNGEMEAGFQSVVWNADNNYGANLASGVYFYRLHARSLETGAEFAQVKKMLLMK